MKKIVLLFLALSLVGTLAAAFWWKPLPPVHTGPVEKIHLGITRTVYSLLAVVAEEQGFFEKNGLDVKVTEYETGRDAVDGLLEGEVEIAAAAEFVFVGKSLEQENLRILATIARSGSEEIVARKDRGISEPSDLKGKRIGVSLNTSAEHTLMKFLLYSHIPLDAVTWVDLPPSQLLEALANGEVDAVISWEHWVYEAKRQLGENGRSWPARMGQGFYWLLISQREIIQAKAPAFERFLRAILEAEEFVRSRESDAQTLLVKRWDREPEFVKYEWKRNKFFLSLDQGLIVTLEGEADWRIESKSLSVHPPPNYLRLIYMDALNAVKPEANLIFR